MERRLGLALLVGACALTACWDEERRSPQEHDSGSDAGADAGADAGVDADADAGTGSATAAYVWHTFYPHSSSQGSAVDDSGNIYVTGIADEPWTGPGDEEPLNQYAAGGYYDLLLLKLAPDGSYGWHTFYGGDGESTIGVSVVVDGSGDILVSGISDCPWDGPEGESPLHAHSGDGAYNLVFLKLDPSGGYIWHTFLPSYGTDVSLAVNASGSIYATGHSGASWNGPGGESPLFAHSEGTNKDVFVVKLDSDGEYVWHGFFGSPEDDSGAAIALDASGSLRVVGTSGGTWLGPSGEPPLHSHSGDRDAFALKLAPDGSYVWHTFYGGAWTDQGFSLAVDAGDNVFVTAWSNTSWSGPGGEAPLHAASGYSNLCVLKLGPNGEYTWHTFFSQGGEDSSSAITLDACGDVAVTGRACESWTGPDGEPPLHAYSGGEDLFILQLASSGDYRWHTFYGSIGPDSGHSLSADGNGNVVAIGWSPVTWIGPAGEPPLNDLTSGYGLFVLKHSL